MSPVFSIVPLAARDETRVQPTVPNFAAPSPSETESSFDAGPVPTLPYWVGPVGSILLGSIIVAALYICYRNARCPAWLMEPLRDYGVKRLTQPKAKTEYDIDPPMYAHSTKPTLVDPNVKHNWDMRAPVLPAAPSYAAGPQCPRTLRANPWGSREMLADPNIEKTWDLRASVVSAAPSYSATSDAYTAPYSARTTRQHPWGHKNTGEPVRSILRTPSSRR